MRSRRGVPLGLLLLALPAGAAAAEGGALAKGLVSLQITQYSPDYQSPWADLPPRTQRAQGVYLGGGLILTSAAPLQDAYMVQAEKDGKPKRYPAEVLDKDYACMLALVKVKDPEFDRTLVPMSLGEDAALHSKGSLAAWDSEGNALTYGGEISKASVFGFYGPVLCLTVSTEAPGLPVGSPFVVGGKLQGLVYSMDSYAKQATVCSVRVLRWFLASWKNGKNAALTHDGLDYADTANDDPLKEFLGLGKGGVYITDVQSGGSCDGLVKEGDALVSVGGRAVDEKGNIEDPVYGRVGYQILFWQGHNAGDKIKLGLVREGKAVTVTVTLKSLDLTSGLICRMVDAKPRYAILGGLVFQDLTYNYLETFGKWREKANKRLAFIEDQGFFKGPRDRKRVVILTRTLPDKVNNGYTDLQDAVLETLNGQKVDSLEDFWEKVEGVRQEGKAEYLTLRFMGGLSVVLPMKTLIEDQQRIFSQYGILSAARL